MTMQACVERAAKHLAEGLDIRDSLPPEAAAELAYLPGGPTIPELTDMIRAQRSALPISIEPLRRTS